MRLSRRTLTDPPYLVGFRDRQGRTIAGDKTDEWLQPACNEMYRVLKKDALMVSFYGWNRVDRFMAAWKNAGFSVVGHLVFTKTYTSKAAYVGYRHECAYILAKGRPRCHKTHCPTCWAGNIQATAITRRKSPLPACNH
ncbi:DNA methylase family protein [Escherichia coli P0304816.14]|nr:DNA methylase family protein [Escherichia coli P0304816.14]